MGKEEKSAVRVMTRVRPFNQRELGLSVEEYPTTVVHMENGKTVHLLGEGGEEKERFEFHKVFWSIPESQKQFCGEPFSDQEAVFEETGKVAVAAAIKGYHTCILAYGQTGSGKTYTMLGSESDPGIAPRLVDHLFEQVEDMPKKGFTYNIGISFMEIYNERCKDLLDDVGSNPVTPLGGRKRRGSRKKSATESAFLNTTSPKDRTLDRSSRRGSLIGRSPGASPNVQPIVGGRKKTIPFSLSIDPEDDYRDLRVRKSPVYGVHVEGLTRLDKESGVSTADDVKLVIRKGMEHRATAETKMNATSSRSHALFQISIVAKNSATGVQRYSNINLVDLAGSERVKMSGAEGDRLTEATKINLSLSTLRHVIDMLIENTNRKKGDIKLVPPYRESLLTWVLSESLGGNSKTMMLATVSPHISNVEDTGNTLRYAFKAKAIVNTVKVNEEKTSVLVSAMMGEIHQLRARMESTAQETRDFEELKEELSDRINEMNFMRDGMEQGKLEVDQLLEDIKKTEEDHKKKMEETQFIVNSKPVIEANRRQADARMEEAQSILEEKEEETERKRIENLLLEQRKREEVEHAAAIKQQVDATGQNVQLSTVDQIHMRRKQFSIAFQMAFSKSRSSQRVAEAEKNVSESNAQCAAMTQEIEKIFLDRSSLQVLNEGLRDRIEASRQKHDSLQGDHSHEIDTTQERVSVLTEAQSNIEEVCLGLSRKRRETEDKLMEAECVKASQTRSFEREEHQFTKDIDLAKHEKVAKAEFLDTLFTQKNLLEREIVTLRGESQQFRQQKEMMQTAMQERSCQFASLSEKNATLAAEKDHLLADLERNHIRLQLLNDDFNEKDTSQRALDEKHRDLKAIVSHKFFPSSTGSVAPRTTSPMRTRSPPREREWIGEGLHYTVSRTHSPPSRAGFTRSPTRTRSPNRSVSKRCTSPTASTVDQNSVRHNSSAFSAPKASGKIR